MTPGPKKTNVCKICGKRRSPRGGGHRLCLKHLREYWRRRHKKYKRDPRRAKDSVLRHTFGITVEDYDRMFKEQGGVCAICGLPSTAKSSTGQKFKDLSVDHDHITGAVRQLLCHHCNAGLGAFKDSDGLLLNAVAYLRRHQCPRTRLNSITASNVRS